MLKYCKTAVQKKALKVLSIFVQKKKTIYIKLTSFNCINEVLPKQNKSNSKFESIIFNPISTNECFVDNEQNPHVSFYHGASILDTQYLVSNKF